MVPVEAAGAVVAFQELRHRSAVLADAAAEAAADAIISSSCSCIIYSNSSLFVLRTYPHRYTRHIPGYEQQLAWPGGAYESTTHKQIVIESMNGFVA